MAQRCRELGGLGVPRAHTTIALYRIPSLLGATGGVLLTYWAALAFVSRRAAFLAGLMMAAFRSYLASRRVSPRPMPCCCSRVAAMARSDAPTWASANKITAGSAEGVPAIFWSARRRNFAEGTADPDVHRAHDRDAPRSSIARQLAVAPQGRLAMAAQTAARRAVDVSAGAAVVHRHHGAQRLELFSESIGHDLAARSVVPRKRTARRPATIWSCSG